MNLRMTVYMLGILMAFEGAFMLVPTATAAVYHEPQLLLFAVIALALIAAGFVITRFKPENKTLFARDPRYAEPARSRQKCMADRA